MDGEIMLGKMTDLELADPAPSNVEPVSLGFGAKLTILNTKLSAAFETKSVTDGRQTRALVMPSDNRKGSMTLAQLITEVNKIIKSFNPDGEIDSEKVTEKIKEIKVVDLDKITVELRQLFFLFDKTTKTDDTEGSKNMEYAFNLVITSGLDPDESMKIFNVESLSFAIWNTKRKVILDRMLLGDIDSLLEQTL